MLSLVRAPRSVLAFALRAFALLATTALASCSPIEVDCAFTPSKCPGIAHTALCSGQGTCTNDGAPAVCDQDGCLLAPGQKLTVQLESSEVSAVTPDFLIHFTAVTPAPADVHVLIDGVEMATEKQLGTEDILVKWTSSSPSPKKLELSFSGGTKDTLVVFSFRDLQCEDDERSACHGGGG